MAEAPYLPPDEREKRARRKRDELIRRGLTPDWFRGSDDLCLPSWMRVAVVGGGFAGLCAAWYLDACGVPTTVYEAGAVVGGRVRTNRSFVKGKIIEDGAELIGENHPLWGYLADRFGLKLEALTDDEAAGLDVRTRFGGKDLTDAQKATMDANLLKFFNAVGALGSGIDEIFPWRSPTARTFDAQSIADLLDNLLGKQSSLERHWVEFTLGNDNCAPVAKQSALGLLASISASRMGSDPAGMLGYWFSTETHRCAKGNDLLASRLAAKLPDLRLRTVVTAIRIEPLFLPAVKIASTEFNDKGVAINRRSDFATHVILTAPPTVWSGIKVDPPFHPAALAMQQGPAVKFMSRYDTRFWEKTKLAPTARWDELGSVWEGTDNQGSAPPFDLTVFSGGDLVHPAAAYPALLATLYPPGKPPDGVPTASQFVDWPHEPHILTGYAIPGVGQITRICPNQIVPHAGRLYFAGEQTSSGFFGYMEGALQSGARAARDIIKSVATPCMRLAMGNPAARDSEA